MTLGAVVGVGVLYALATEGDGTSQFGLVETVNTAAMNIVDTTFPATTYDVVAVALGETLAGLTGAAASLSLKLFLANARKIVDAVPRPTALASTEQLSHQRQPQSQRPVPLQQRAQTMINQAAAETDYFLARAAILPLLVEGVGLSPALATLASSLVATLPYQAVKLGKQQRAARQEENRLLAQLLRQEQQQQQQQKKYLQATTIRQRLPNQAARSMREMQSWMQRLRQPRASPSSTTTTAIATSSSSTTTIINRVDPSTLQPIQSELENTIDGVDLFADTCKWLSYSVLMNEFSGTLQWHGLPLGTGVESGFYGLLATLTSQIYADFLYFVVRTGPASQQAQVRNRAGSEWLLLYVSKSIGAFTLFGVYASVQLPVRIAVNALLSGGIDSCIGSVDVDVCMETYYLQNPPSADMGAQLRAIATTLYSFSHMPSIVGDENFYYSSGWAGGGGASVDAQLRAVITTLVSLWSRIFY